jgi:hypothetical protein
MLKFFLMFALVSVVDFMWANYIAHIAKGNAVLSSLFGAAIYLLGSVVTINYVNDHWMLVPAVLGALVGTYLSVKLKK